jgi:hypothetical protein
MLMKVEFSIFWKNKLVFVFFFSASIVGNEKELAKRRLTIFEKEADQRKSIHESEKPFIDDDVLAEEQEVRKFQNNWFN